MTSVPHPFRRLFGEKSGTQISYSPIKKTNSWRPRDYLAAAVLFGATAAIVVWQNSRVAVLWDLGYLLDTSWRIACGQMPYRDFPLAHAPLTFLIQAGLIHLGGRDYLIPIAYAAITGGLASVLTWRLLFGVVRGFSFCCPGHWFIALLLAAPLPVVGIYSIYPHPIYDCDCALAILIAVLMLACQDETWDAGAKAPEERSAATARQKSGPDTNSGPFTKHVGPLAAGAATVLPLFFKQNMGLPFLAVVGAGMFILLLTVLVRTRSLCVAVRSQPALILAGMVAALLVALAALAATAGLGNYIHWTVQFAAQRRMPGLAPMVAVYAQPSLGWTLPALACGLILCHTRLISGLWARIAAVCLISAPFAGSLIFLFAADDAEDRADNLLALWPLLLLGALVIAALELRRGITLGRLLPLFILAAIHGTLLSQQLWGSTYAMWPLLLVLVAFILGTVPELARSVAIGASAVISITFLICGGLYAASLERLGYVQIPEEPAQRTETAALRGMRTPGPFLSNLDELVEFASREIPPDDPIVLLPGEDPFYYATGRTVRFPVTLFDPATDPYWASGMLDEERRRNVRWVIVKRALQINENPMPDRERTMDMVQREFVLYRRLRGYDVYRR
jgi:hypothetical protein